jgi:hypothetical protein
VAAISASLLLAGLAAADWRDHPELPDWARRGYVQWGHGANIDGRIKWAPGGFGADVANVKLLLYCGRNLQQTIAYLDDDAARLAAEGGLRRQPYICSQTVWWRTEETKTPELTGAVRLGLDGKPIIVYSNPDRHCGCYNAPFWLEYTKRKIKATIEGAGGRVDSIFFDNPLPYECSCSHCRGEFRAYSRDKFGVEMDLAHPESYPNFAFAKKLFDLDSTYEFFEQIKEYARTLDPTLTISPNMGVGSGESTYLTSRGTTQMVFCERGFSLPPFESTVIDYKLGLAASHGLAVGQLLGLPESLRRVRALSLDANNEAGILESLMYPEEHKLSFAEGLACGGTYIASFALREQKICVGEAPHHVAVREALHEYAEFAKEHLHLYDLAQPGSRLAVLNSVWTELADRSAARNAFASACTAFARAGIPYEVLIEDDLRPDVLAPYRLVLLPQVRSLSVDDANALLDYVRAGGALLVVGPAALRDRLARAYPADRLTELAKLPVGEPQPLEKGRLLRSDQVLTDLPPQALHGMVEKLIGPLDCRVIAGTGELFANLLRTRDGKTLSVHLVNSDFAYEDQPSSDIRDDHGMPTARTFFARPEARARKTLLVPDPAQARGFVLRFFGNSCWAATDSFSVVVSLNGQDLKTYKGSELRNAGWYEVPIPDRLLKERNEATFRALGKPNGHPDWFALKIDTEAATRRSSWSEDDGRTWTEVDLSPDPGAQTGEYLVRFGPPTDPEAVAKPEDFIGKLHVRPARAVEVVLKTAGTAPAGKLVSPEAPDRTVTPTIAGGVAKYRIPEVHIYSVLVLR